MSQHSHPCRGERSSGCLWPALVRHPPAGVPFPRLDTHRLRKQPRVLGDLPSTSLSPLEPPSEAKVDQNRGVPVPHFRGGVSGVHNDTL